MRPAPSSLSSKPTKKPFSLQQHGRTLFAKSKRQKNLHDVILAVNVIRVAWLINDVTKLADLDEYGRTPLHLAAFEVPRMIPMLIKAGATLDTMSPDGSTALHFAVERGHITAVQALTEAGARVDICNAQDETPLAVCFGPRFTGDRALRAKILAVLLDANADAGTVLRGGTTVLTRAAMDEDGDAVGVLYRHGADMDHAMYMVTHDTHDERAKLLLMRTRGYEA